MRRLQLYFYGRSNLIGMGLACLGPILLFSGVVDKAWWLVSVSGYGMGWAAGALLFPATVIDQKADMSLADVQSFLDKLLREHSKKLPPEAVAHLQSIQASLAQAAPRFQELFEKSGRAGSEWLVFRQVILSYLPETLSNYLRLPATYAAVHKVGNTGKTPKLLLAEQLSVMDAELQKTVQSLFENDANQMLVTSKFLEQKFERAEDFLA
jgi:hypothetical protein